MRTLILTFLLAAPLLAADAPRTFPLWDGHESVESYAQRVNLPPARSIDLGNGMTLDLLLIPAGKFVMGTPLPKPPSVTDWDAKKLFLAGGFLGIALLVVSLVKKDDGRSGTFSLRWLLLITIAFGLMVGGVARGYVAAQEAARYEIELAAFNVLPDDEKPAHSVTLTHPFYIGKYMVTQEQYRAAMKRSPSKFIGAQLPVESVSWDDAAAFCKTLTWWLPSRSEEVRLPTEAQWEYACRGGTRTRFYSGDSNQGLNTLGWSDSNSGGKTHPVGQLKANAFGLYDMHGNVWELCQDFWDDHYPSNNSAQDPIGPKEGVRRVMRGGSALTYPEYCRSACRSATTPDTTWEFRGFRVVVEGLEF